jgi:hypothetical protein
VDRNQIKADFLQNLQNFALTLKNYISTPDNQWTVKGFIDVFENIYTISADTKIISKILEIHLFSKFLEFANENDFDLVLAEKQNWYPDISFVSKSNPHIKFAVDLKTTYRLENNPAFCNGFTLGSHGEYFINQNSTKKHTIYLQSIFWTLLFGYFVFTQSLDLFRRSHCLQQN